MRSRCGFRRPTASSSSPRRRSRRPGADEGALRLFRTGHDAARHRRARSRPGSRRSGARGLAARHRPLARRRACSPASRRRATRPPSPRSPRPRSAAPTTRSTSARARPSSRRRCRTSGGARTTSSSPRRSRPACCPASRAARSLRSPGGPATAIREGSFTLPTLLRADGGVHELGGARDHAGGRRRRPRDPARRGRARRLQALLEQVTDEYPDADG